MPDSIDIPHKPKDKSGLLEAILTSPQRLTGFERYLKRNANHKHLVLLEELRQLRYEIEPNAMAITAQR
jgi:hypothetical protein